MGSMRPPVVKQGMSWRCWAACMESWSFISYYWPNTLQEKFQELYGTSNGALDTNSDQFSKFLTDFNVDLDLYNAGTFTAAAASRYLNGAGYFMFIELIGGKVSHARLAWGIEDGVLQAMEPMPGRPEYITGKPEALGRLMIVYWAGY